MYETESILHKGRMLMLPLLLATSIALASCQDVNSRNKRLPEVPKNQTNLTVREYESLCNGVGGVQKIRSDSLDYYQTNLDGSISSGTLRSGQIVDIADDCSLRYNSTHPVPAYDEHGNKIQGLFEPGADIDLFTN